jgi:hypothetical protein
MILHHLEYRNTMLIAMVQKFRVDIDIGLQNG